MMDNSRKKNLFLEHEAFFYPSNSDPVLDSDDDEGDSGAGIATLSIEELSAYLRALFNKERRERPDGQRKFAICPLSEDPNSLLGKKSSRSCDFGQAMKIHPLLAHSQQFSGDDASISANPIDNSGATKRFFEERLENQYRLQKNRGLGVSKTVTLAR